MSGPAASPVVGDLRLSSGKSEGNRWTQEEALGRRTAASQPHIMALGTRATAWRMVARVGGTVCVVACDKVHAFSFIFFISFLFFSPLSFLPPRFLSPLHACNKNRRLRKITFHFTFIVSPLCPPLPSFHPSDTFLFYFLPSSSLSTFCHSILPSFCHTPRPYTLYCLKPLP